MSKYFKYDDEYISGGQYFIRNIVAVILCILLVGIYLLSVNAYKRARSLGNSSATCKFFAVWGFLSIFIGYIPGLNLVNVGLYWYLWFSNGNPNKVVEDSNNDTILNDSNAFNDVNFSPNEETSFNNEFNTRVKIIFTQFELDLNAENLNDYPVPYWYDIVKGRAESMKLGNSNKPISDVQNEWIWMHADEYTTKYYSVSQEDSIQAISLRIERFGFIYKKLCILEQQLHDLVKEYNLESNPFLAQFDWDKASAAASLYGSINFALSAGMSNDDITKLYSDFVYDEDLISGTDPFAAFGATKEEAYSTIKEELGVDMDTVKSKKVKIRKKISSILAQLDLQERYAVFTILGHIANSDGTTDDEYIVLNDIRLELDINLSEHDNAKMDGGQACDLLQDLNQEQKDELSRYIILIVGADGEFSSTEMLWVNDVIRELDLDNNLIIQLTDKYWSTTKDDKVVKEANLKEEVKEEHTNFNEKQTLEISHEEMNEINDEEIYTNKDGNPFSGILISSAIDDIGKIECAYVDGKRHGEYTKYDNKDDNKISHNKFYKQGRLHGADTYWWEKFKDERDSEETNYSADADLGKELGSMMDNMLKKHDVMRQVNYKDGLFHGKFFDCNWNGGINFEINFKEGKKDGVWNQYFQTPLGSGQGALKKVSIYKNDKHISSIYYDFDNEEITKEDALNDEEWGGEGWEQNQEF